MNDQIDTIDNIEHCIAIVGMAGRFPGADDVAGLWRNVLDAKVALKRFSPEEVQASILADDRDSIPFRVEEVSGGSWVAAGFWMDDIDKFDADFFGYTPAEAELLDPQQRLFLEASWAAVEDAGYVPDAFDGIVGVFGGAAMSRYFLKNVYSHREIMYSTRDLTAGIGNEPDYVTNRVAFKFNYTGPAVSVQTACSTSLVAVHLACQSLLTGETDMCLAGGVLVSVPGGGYLYREGSMNSPDGAIRAFDADAEGTVFSDAGVAVVCLKRLEDALRDRDQIHAVIRGTAVGNDGAVKAGYTAPGVAGQKKVILEALQASAIEPDTIGYMEAHGTGTPLGDPVELNALTQAWRGFTDRTGFCGIGSLKPNIGHLATAAGVASLIKAALVVREGVIPPLANYRQPNPMIDFAASPFYVPDGLQPWPEAEVPRRAAVSSFGIGGTNAHVIVEQPPQATARAAARGPWLLPLSARTPAALQRQAGRLADWLDAHPDADLRDVAFTLQQGRKTFDTRLAVAGDDPAALAAALRAGSAGEGRRERAPKLAWMFSGQGAQYVDMARGLHGRLPAFTEILDRCLDRLADAHGLDLRPLLLSAEGADREAAAQTLARTEYAQPALFCVEYALARQLQDFGLAPAALIGHSLGEYVAACLAGVFAPDAALDLVALRGRLMQSMPAGAMLAVSLDADQLRPYLALADDPELAIAADNAPGTSVAAGPTAAIERLRARLEAEGHACRTLVTSHAFHSPSMRPIVAEFEAAVRNARPAPPTQPFVSNVTGTWITEADAVDPAYWSGHLLGTVRFREGLRTLADAGCDLLLEVGPGNTLATFARRALGAGANAPAVIETLRHPREQDDDARRLLQALGRAWTQGLALDWSRIADDAEARRISLPTYAFERESHWLRAAESGGGEILQRLPSEQWYTVPTWTRGRRGAMPTAVGDWSGRVVVLSGPEQAHAAALASALRDAGARVVRLHEGRGAAIAQEAGIDGIAVDGMTVHSGDPAQWSQAMQAIVAGLGEGERLAFVRLPALDLPDAPVAEDLDSQFFALLHATVALAESGSTAPPVLLSVSAGAFPVLPGETLRPMAATAIGVHLSIGHEMPTWSTRHVDFDSEGARDTALPSRIAAELDALFAAPSPQLGWAEKAVAYRLGARWTPDLETASLPPANASSIRRGGVYLITGGLGGIGLTLAQAFAERGAAALVLVGRSALPPRAEWNTRLDGGDETARRIRAVLSIEALGAKVEIVGADVRDAEALSALVGDVCARHGRIDGAVHAAGVAGGGVMQLKRREDALRVLEPKIFGAHALCAALAAHPAARAQLGFVALLSSLYAQLGGVGQVDYAAANAWLDSFAHHARARWNLPVTSFGWGPWEDVGMAARHGHTAAAPVAAGTPFDDPHPLVQTEVARSEDRFEIAAVLRPAALWLLTDHRLSGVPAMPGTGLLEMVRAGHERLSGARFARFEDVFFFRPLFVAAEAGVEARVRYEAIGEARWRFEVLEGDGHGGFAAVATGVVAPVVDDAPAFDAAAVAARCGAESAVYADGRMPVLGEEGFLALGRHWDVVHRLDFGARDLVADLQLPDDAADDAARYPLHPSLLDMATGPITGHLLARMALEIEGEYLPSNYGRLRQYAPLQGRLRSFVRFEGVEEDGESILFSIDILGEHGPVASIERFALRRVAAGRARAKVDAEPSRAWSDAISPAEGVDAFERILAAPEEPHWVILPMSVKGLIARQREELRRAAESSGRRAQVQRRDDDGFAAPRTDAERLLADIYEKVLGVAPIGIHDNFFELGGDSVIGIQIVAQAKARGLQVKPGQLFDFQTIAELAAEVGGSLGASDAAAPPAAAPAPAAASAAAGPDVDDSGLSEEDLKSLLSL